MTPFLVSDKDTFLQLVADLSPTFLDLMQFVPNVRELKLELLMNTGDLAELPCISHLNSEVY